MPKKETLKDLLSGSQERPNDDAPDAAANPGASARPPLPAESTKKPAPNSPPPLPSSGPPMPSAQSNGKHAAIPRVNGKDPTPLNLSSLAASAPSPQSLPGNSLKSTDGATSKASAASPKPTTPPPAAPQPQSPSVENESNAEKEPAFIADPSEQPKRRKARRRPAGPSRERVAANDDVPSIGGLIYALNQRPSNRPFVFASAASGLWAAIVLGFAITFFGNEIARIGSVAGVIQRPELLTVAATLVGPVLLIWALAFLLWRTEELRLRSTAMTEVAIRLAEPDRMAEQQVASLGQAVRRQVSFMNEAVERALGRAGELQALVHKEVAELEQTYDDNERKIKGLINGLASERDALLTTSGSVSETLQTLGGQVPKLIERLSQQQIVLSEIIDGAGKNLTALETAIATQTGNLETALGTRTENLQIVLEEYTSALGTAMDDRTTQFRGVLEDQRTTMDKALTERTEQIQNVFEEYTRALDASLANRAEALDMQLIERTRVLDDAFTDRLRMFDESIQRTTVVIDEAVTEKAIALNAAMEHHARSLGSMLGNQAAELDENLMQGINAVRRTSENITRQSLQAIEGLSKQSEMLRNISENLLSQIHGVTSRFEHQGQNILRAANALENANYKIDSTLQSRHVELESTLNQLTNRAQLIGNEFTGYSSRLEGSIADAENRARLLTSELSNSAQEQSRAVLSEIERLKQAASEDTHRALEDLRNKFSSVSDEMTSRLHTMSSRFNEASHAAKRTTAEAAAALETEQQRLREQIARLPATARDGSDAVRQSLRDQLRALEHLSQLSSQQARQHDIARPMQRQPNQPQHRGAALPPPPGYTTPSRKELASLGSALNREMRDRGQTNYGAGPSPSPASGSHPPSSSSESWSLGDLLERASRDDAIAPMAGPIDIGKLARAIDANTASAIWSRLGAGQSGIMVRSIYSPDGRTTFDEAFNRYRSDPAYQHSVNTYIGDFERLLEQAEAKDPSGRTGQNYLLSDVGRAYLVLAHAIGRIS